VPDGYDSDKLVNYEIGVKYESPDRRYFVSLAGYYIDWSDIQLVLRTSPSATGTQYAYTGNAGSARVYGSELEATLRPIRGLSIGFSGSYIDAATTATIPGAGVDGERIPYTPRWSGSASIDYTFESLAFPIFLGADVAYTDSRFTDFAANSGYYFKLDSYTVVNARAGIEIGNARVSLNLRNAFDDDTVTDVFTQTAGVSLNGFYRVQPRMLSLEMSASF
jgi:iron complex outermembrane receptor protein